MIKVENCVNHADITGKGKTAGIIAYLLIMGEETDLRLTVENCTNEGTIQSVTCAGGILGFSNVGFNSETANMDISASTKVSVRACTNNGSVTVLSSNSMAGGIVGRIGDALLLTTGEGVETSVDNVNAAQGNIVISGCRSSGAISAPDYSFILNKGGKPLYVNYLGGVVGQCSATNGYAFGIENCTYSGAERGLGSTDYSDAGTKN